MVRRIPPAEKVSRLLDLVPFLYSHQGISVDDLASSFAVTRSEILSDLNTLWMCGESRFDLVELEFESGFVYIRNADAVNMVRSLSAQESMTLLFGLDILREDVSSERADLISEISKLRLLLGSSVGTSVAATPAVTSAILTEIQSAIAQRSSLEISYHSIAVDGISTRSINPLELFHREGKAFLLAYCQSAHAMRTFRVDRIKSAQHLESGEFADSEPLLEAEKVQAVIKIHSGLRKAHEVFGDIQERVDGAYLISIYSESWLMREILASGGKFEVVEPVSMREKISAQMIAISAQYG